MAVNVYGFDLERDAWSRDASERLLPDLFREIFGAQSVEWAWRVGLDRLDRDYGVDAVIQTPRRNIAVAVRLRSYRHYLRFGDVTLRYDSLQQLNKLLEVQKSIARFMFFGWCDSNMPEPANKVIDWHVIWLQRLLDGYFAGWIKTKEERPTRNKDQSSRFIAFDVRALKKAGVVLASAGSVGTSAKVRAMVS